MGNVDVLCMKVKKGKEQYCVMIARVDVVLREDVRVSQEKEV
jgi:hypothetical protein